MRMCVKDVRHDIIVMYVLLKWILFTEMKNLDRKVFAKLQK